MLEGGRSSVLCLGVIYRTTWSWLGAAGKSVQRFVPRSSGLSGAERESEAQGSQLKRGESGSGAFLTSELSDCWRLLLRAVSAGN